MQIGSWLSTKLKTRKRGRRLKIIHPPFLQELAPSPSPRFDTTMIRDPMSKETTRNTGHALEECRKLAQLLQQTE